MKCPCETHPRGLAATVISAILMLSACGGGGTVNGWRRRHHTADSGIYPAHAAYSAASSTCQAPARRDPRSLLSQWRPCRDRPGLRQRARPSPATDPLSMTLKPNPVVGRLRPAPGAGSGRQRQRGGGGPFPLLLPDALGTRRRGRPGHCRFWGAESPSDRQHCDCRLIARNPGLVPLLNALNSSRKPQLLPVEAIMIAGRCSQAS